VRSIEGLELGSDAFLSSFYSISLILSPKSVHRSQEEADFIHFNSSHSQRRADTTRRNDDDHEHQECLMMISSSPLSSGLPQNGAFASHSKDAENGNEKLKTPSTACS
jgi:hypothetical protein